MFEEFQQYAKFRAAWNAVRIERAVPYTLFTFGDSELPYYLITGGSTAGHNGMVRIRRGQVTITRARIITPDSMHPELQDFFNDEDDNGLVHFLMSRTAAFSNLKLSNHSGPDKIVTDTVAEAVARLNQQLDAAAEDRVAVLSAPAELAGFAVFRYASEKIMSSAPGNIQELREKGLLP
jgi:hypothetical protein